MKSTKSESKKKQRSEGSKNGVGAERKKKKVSNVPKDEGRDGTQSIQYLTMAVLVILIAVGAFYLYNNIESLAPESFPAPESQSTSDASPPQDEATSKKGKPPKTSTSTKETDAKSSAVPPTDVPPTAVPPTDVPPKKSEESRPKTPEPIKNVYSKAALTNNYDDKIRAELDSADDLLLGGKLQDAIKKYNNILAKHSQSARARFGLAKAIGQEAEQEKSNALLEQSINEFVKVVDAPNILMPLLKEAVRIGVGKMHFRGWTLQAAKFVKRVADKYPEDVELNNKLGVCYLMTGRVEQARDIFKYVLNMAPHDGFALAHYGFILKTADDNSLNAIPYLQTGIESGAPGTDDGRFYFHLGDALNRVGRKKESYVIYEEGAKRGHFLSKYQRSLYNVDTLAARPWWTLEQTTYQRYLKILEDNWETIRDEGLAQMDQEKNGFKAEEENLREKGDWRQFTLWAQGRKDVKNCERTPRTCALLDQIPEAKGCRRGQIKYSVMQPGVHVWPHCGPTNCRIRAHLGLVVPPGPKIRVAEDERKWTEGKFIIFDDSFEHEVWHEGESFRLVLIVDFWHPELTAHQKATLPSI